MSNSKTKKQQALTEVQKMTLPGMLATFLLVAPNNQSAQHNLQVLIDLLDDDNQMKVYEVVKRDLTARVRQQIVALQQELERM